MNKTKYFISLAAMLFGCTAVNAAAKASLSSVGVYSAANDTVDIDEEEFGLSDTGCHNYFLVAVS